MRIADCSWAIEKTSDAKRSGVIDDGGRTDYCFKPYTAM
jgi:hypothetical protein